MTSIHIWVISTDRVHWIYEGNLPLLLSFDISTWQTESYSYRVSENGATFTEDVEVDVDNQTEVFRVPQHNDVDAMEMMNDFREVGLVNFKKKVCFIKSISVFLQFFRNRLYFLKIDKMRLNKNCDIFQTLCPLDTFLNYLNGQHQLNPVTSNKY